VLPTTIDGVIDRLQSIVDDSIRTGSRLGYFAALYKRMTMAIRDGMSAGRFDDNARIERLDIAFASRYLVTRDQYFAGELHGQSYLQAYSASNAGNYTVLQQLLIGINPHIMIDLGVAAARTCPGAQLAGLEHDFNTVNAVILALFPIIDEELDDLSPFERFVDHNFLGFLKDKAIDLSIDAGRRSSWGFATSLAYLDLPAQAIAIGRRDLEALALGECILKLPAIGSKRESKDVAHNIRVLNAPAKTPQTSSRQP
jgi:Family of unknown function (DUF5995)